jgi:hypothetical protein
MERVGTPRLPRSAGLNRFAWDLTLPGAWDANPQRSGRNGPLVVPGEYKVRLTAGSYTAEQSLTVKPDPRIAKDGVTLADLREQLEHNLRVRDMVSEVNELVDRVEGARRRLANAGGTSADTLSKLNELRARLVTPAVRYSKPELQAHIAYLYSLTTDADQKIGRDAVERYKQLRTELDQRQAEAAMILGKPGVKAMH